MDNPNPIYYRDLIQPDESIKQLIDQLSEVIGQYEKLRTEVQKGAQDAAKAMQGLSGATDEQRQAIAQNAQRAEEMAQKYRKLTDEEVQLKAAQQEVIAANREAVKMARLQKEAAEAAEGSYKKLSAQYRINKEMLNKMSFEERHAHAAGRLLEAQTKAIYEEMSRLQKATGKYTLEVGHYENALKSLPGPTGQLVGAFDTMRNSLNGISASSLPAAQKGMAGMVTTITGVIGIISVLGRALSGAGKTIRDFEQANTNLSTILGATDVEMKSLSESARALGRDSEWTASQVVALQTELAKLGFTIPEIKNMQEAVLNFATATGADLASAASVAGASLRAFGLDSSQTEDALNVLVAATNRSALSFDRIQQSVGTVFPIAKAFGVTLRDTTALLGALANAGFDASSAATATRNILLKLANSNGELAKRMGGAVNTFDGMVAGLRKLSEEGINLAEVLKLTDNRSVSAFSAFIDGVDSVNALRDSLEDVDGVLKDIAEKRMATTEGAVKQLNSAWDNLVLSFDKGNNVFGSLTLFATDFIKAITPKTDYDKAKKQIDEVFARYGEDAKAAAEEVNQQLVFMQIQMEQFASLQPKSTIWDKIFGRDPNAEGKRMAAQIQEQINNIVDLANQALQERSAQYSWSIFGDGTRGEFSVIAPEAAGSVSTATGGADGGGGKKTTKSAAWSLQNDRKYMTERAKILREYLAGEIATREEYDARLSELEITTLEGRLGKLREGSTEYIKIETQLNEKRITLRDKEQKATEAAIEASEKARAEALKVEQKYMLDALKVQEQEIKLRIAAGDDLQLELLEKQREIALESNRQLSADLQVSDALINAKFDKLIDDAQRKAFEAADKAAKSLDKKKAPKMAEDLFDVFGIQLGEEGEAEDVLEQRKRMLLEAVGEVKEAVSSLVDSWREQAHAAVEAADTQVESAQKIVDAEIEAQAQGYAANVARAQAELQQAKKNREEALKEEQKAQAAQMALDTATQASSLVTASANIWKSLSGVPLVGPALAVAALALMWGSFAASKIKAAQVAKETYGEGTVELLKGGSHASGNDIYLGTTEDGKERRAEGGEYFAVINKRNSRKYGALIPDVINSFNDGTFAEKYMRSGEAMKGYAIQMMAGADLTKVEAGIDAIRKQGEESRTTEGGYTVVRYKNLTRRIKS